MADMTVEIRWADAGEQARAKQVVADANGQVLDEFDGLLVARLPEENLPFVTGANLPCTRRDVGPVMKGAGLESFAPTRQAQDPGMLESVRKFVQKSTQVKGRHWEKVVGQLDLTKVQSAVRGGLEAMVPAVEQLLDEDMYVVRLKEALRPAWRDQLEKFSRLLAHDVPNEFRLKLSKAEVGLVRALNFVTEVHRYGVLETLTGTMKEFLNSVAVQSPDDRFLFDLVVHGAEDREKVLEFLEDQDPGDVTILKPTKEGRQKTTDRSRGIRIEAKAGSPVLAALAVMPEVRSMAPYQPPRLELDQAAKLLGAHVVGNGNPLVPWTGAGQVVAFFDSGIDANHPDLKEALAKPPGIYGSGVAADQHGHGTHVAGIIAGRGNAVRGIAPGCKLLSYSIRAANGTLDIPPDLSEMLELAVEDGAKIINLSWRAALRPEYDIYGESLDRFLRKHPEVLVVVAAGNDGRATLDASGQKCLHKARTIGAPAVAKNTITVGACRNLRPNYAKTFGELFATLFPQLPVSAEPIAGPPHVPAAFSSRGPSMFNSAKPDLVAPGTMVLSTRAAQHVPGLFDQHTLANGLNPEHYGYMSGTSMAAPMVAGTAAIVREYLAKEHGMNQPSAALVKALLLLATVREQNVSSNSLLNDPRIGAPDFDQGHGRLDLRELLPHSKAPAKRRVKVFDVANDSAEALEVFNPVPVPNGRKSFAPYPINVAASNVPLRLALCWTDPPGRGVQNRMSLRLRLPDNSNVFGNESHKLFADPVNLLTNQQIVDTNNNALVIHVPNPPVGNYLAVVTAESTAIRYQGYGLAVTGALA